MIIVRAFNERLRDTGRRLWEFCGPLDLVRLGFRFAARVADRLNAVRPLTRPYSARDVARRDGVPVHAPARINAPAFVQLRRESVRPDLLVSVAASRNLRARVLETPPQGCAKPHSAPLPRSPGMMSNFSTISLHDLRIGSKGIAVGASLEGIEQTETGAVVRRLMDPSQATCFSFPEPAAAECLRRMGRALR